MSLRVDWRFDGEDVSDRRRQRENQVGKVKVKEKEGRVKPDRVLA